MVGLVLSVKSISILLLFFGSFQFCQFNFSVRVSNCISVFQLRVEKSYALPLVPGGGGLLKCYVLDNLVF